METIKTTVMDNGVVLRINLEVEYEDIGIWSCTIEYLDMRYTISAGNRKEVIERGKRAWLAIDAHYHTIQAMIES